MELFTIIHRYQRIRDEKLAYYKRHLLYGTGHPFLIELIKEEYPYETAHLELGVWIRRKLKLL